MATEAENIQRDLKDFILEEFLPGEKPEALAPDTPLVTTGILDSLATLKLVSFLEERFGISLEAHEVDAEYLDTIQKMADLVVAKKGTT